MEYSPEQRDIIRRMGELSAEMDRLVAENRAAQADAGRGLVDAVTKLTNAMEHSARIMPVFLQHGDLFREFLDTL